MQRETNVEVSRGFSSRREARRKRFSSLLRHPRKVGPALVLKLGIRRIGSENSRVRALRMVSLRNALAIFITGDSRRRKHERKARKETIREQENVSGWYMFDHSSSSEGIRICRFSSSTFPTRSLASSKMPW